MTSKSAFCVLFLLLALRTELALGQADAGFKISSDINSFVQTYYQAPAPERIADLIKSLDAFYPFINSGSIGSMGGFLGEVFRANPNSVKAWEAIGDTRDRGTKEVLALASRLMNNKNGVLDVHNVAADINDMYWGAFFATGDRKYIDRLIDELTLYDINQYPHKTTYRFDGKNDFDSFFAGATAAWSLSALLNHAPVKQSVTAAEAQASGRKREVLEDVLTKAPNQIKVEMRYADVGALQGLSTDSAKIQPDAITDSGLLATSCATALEKVRSYVSVSHMLNRAKPQHAFSGYLLGTWTSEAVEPDRAHVWQTAWSGDDRKYLFDEYILIKNSTFANVGIQWLEMPSRKDVGSVNKLGLGKYAQVLRDQRPTSAAAYLYSGKRYLLLSYVLPVAGDLAEFFMTPGTSQQPGRSLQLELWIDSTSGLLAKARAIESDAPPGAAQLEFEQLFVGYSDSIEIAAPPGVSGLR